MPDIQEHDYYYKYYHCRFTNSVSRAESMGLATEQGTPHSRVFLSLPLPAWIGLHRLDLSAASKQLGDRATAALLGQGMYNCMYGLLQPRII